MTRKKTKKQTLTQLPKNLAAGKLLPWSRVAPKSVFPLEHGSRAGVIVDNRGTPQLFVFDTNALLDVLSRIDEELVDRVSPVHYYSKRVNPAGWLIDELESKLPLNPHFVTSLRDSISEAKKKGWIPFSKIQKALKLLNVFD